MYTTKECKMCGAEFKGMTNARYCSAVCRIQFKTEYDKKWREKNIEHYRQYQRDYQKLYQKG